MQSRSYIRGFALRRAKRDFMKTPMKIEYGLTIFYFLDRNGGVGGPRR